MKSIIIRGIIVLTFILIITSCEKFLKEEPKTQISIGQYFNKPEDAISLVNGLYYVGAPAYYQEGGHSFNGTYEMMSGFMSGLINNERIEQPGPYEAQHLTMNPDNMSERMQLIWSAIYDAISRANYAIKYIPKIERLSQIEANILLGEAKYFRAYNYFWLVKYFGGVPIITEPYESLDNIYVKRDPDKDVYNLIITDLKWALDIAGLADVPYYMNGFRVTKGLVATLLADVYLQNAGYPVRATESYAEATKAARMVINSGVYNLIEHGDLPENSAYNKMRTSETELEYIFAIEYESGLRPNRMTQFTIPRYSLPPGCKYGDTWNAYRPLDEFVRIYNPDKDLRIQNEQIWHNKMERGGVTYDFQGWAPYLWFDENAMFVTGKSGKDIIVYRYAEVLLIAAEAIAQSEGVTNEAVSYLTDVRSRAYWNTDRSEIESELNGLSKEQFIEEIWKERHRELVLDYNTWPDIQRTRKYPVTSESNPGEVDFVDVIGHTNPFGATFQEYNLLYPLSASVIQRNPELVQNPGYN